MAHADAAGRNKAAIERVLRAERDAEIELARTREQVQAELAQARDDALAIVNRAAQRIAAWQLTHAERLDRRLAAQREQAEQNARTRITPDAQAIAAAVARVAAQLTGSAGEHPA